MTIITRNTLKTQRHFIEISFYPTRRTTLSAHVVPTPKQDEDHECPTTLNITKITRNCEAESARDDRAPYECVMKSTSMSNIDRSDRQACPIAGLKPRTFAVSIDNLVECALARRLALASWIDLRHGSDGAASHPALLMVVADRFVTTEQRCRSVVRESDALVGRCIDAFVD